MNGLELANELLRQIGVGVILSISGGRKSLLWSQDGKEVIGVWLPVSSGYRVEVALEANDTYTVRRVFVRSGKRFEKGEERDIYADQVGDAAAYRAGMYKNVEFGSEAV